MLHPSEHKPRIAVVMSNTLACMGLKQLLLSMMPRAEVCMFGSMEGLHAAESDDFLHYFISSDILLHNVDFFTPRCRHTFVLVHGNHSVSVPAAFRTIDVCQHEEKITKDLLRLEQQGHGTNRPQAALIKKTQNTEASVLTPREKEVLRLVVSGYINKEIASQLHVSLTTIISHRKNLTEKLKTRSVSALTIYAVMHGIVRVEDI